jgi:hypothetical protein
MRYAKPQVEEMGQANDLVQVIFNGGFDIEASTGRIGYSDDWPDTATEVNPEYEERQRPTGQAV